MILNKSFEELDDLKLRVINVKNKANADDVVFGWGQGARKFSLVGDPMKYREKIAAIFNDAELIDYYDEFRGFIAKKKDAFLKVIEKYIPKFKCDNIYIVAYLRDDTKTIDMYCNIKNGFSRSTQVAFSVKYEGEMNELQIKKK